MGAKEAEKTEKIKRVREFAVDVPIRRWGIGRRMISRVRGLGGKRRAGGRTVWRRSGVVAYGFMGGALGEWWVFNPKHLGGAEWIGRLKRQTYSTNKKNRNFFIC